MLSILILAGILIVTVGLVRDLIGGVASILARNNSFEFKSYISLIMQLIINACSVISWKKHMNTGLLRQISAADRMNEQSALCRQNAINVYTI